MNSSNNTSSTSSPRIILFTGKGGVGKTTTAAATALCAAEQGSRTLVISTDPAHSLGDALHKALSPEPQQIAPNLFAQELDVYYSMKKYWGNVRSLLLTVFQWQGLKSIVAEELAALPGMEEASAFLWLDNYVQAREYDCIIIDSAPTGETLTLLTLPQTVQWWMTRAFPFQKAAVQTVGAAVRTITGIPLDKGFLELDAIFEKLQRMQRLMTNPEVASIRLVMNPERMVIQEARRAYTYLQMYGFNVDAVIVNRVLPDIATRNNFFAEYIASQKKYLQEIEASFAPLPMLKVPHMGKEVFGMDLLREISANLYAHYKPLDFYYKECPFELAQQGKNYILKTKIPFASEGEIQVKRLSDELIIHIKNRRKNLFLPRFLSYYTLEHHTLVDNWLSLTFAPASENA
ncbi:MAG: ArsA family ATPase [Bacteroidota bacterium]|nr:ArsA family ATPase [Candidatus Kapabacteria bacterium]MDW8220748.1 ArsA family ATPase [Bacteroidota bacterium]